VTFGRNRLAGAVNRGRVLQSKVTASKLRARKFAAILAIAALLAQFWAPAIAQVRADLIRDSSYAEFVRVFGSNGVLCVLDKGAPLGQTTPGKSAPAHDPLQCPICQSLHVLNSLVSPTSAALVVPAASGQVNFSTDASSFAAPHYYLSGEARAPPVTI